MYPGRSLDDYGESGRVLGRGAYGEVELRENNEGRYAVKKMHLFDDDEDLMSSAIRELAISTKMDHPNVVRLMDVIVMNDEVYMVMEYASKGTLESIKDVTVSYNDIAVHTIYQFLLGVAYIHSLDIIHRDIKPTNVLVSDKEVKIADFGLSRALICSFDSGITEMMYTLWYRPPEVLYGSNTYGLSGDVWAAGCVVYYVLTGMHLFMGKDEFQMIELIEKMFGTPTDETWKGVSELPYYQSVHPRGRDMFQGNDKALNRLGTEWRKIVEEMLVMNPNKRTTVYTVLQNPIFDNFRNKELERGLTSCLNSLNTFLIDGSSTGPDMADRAVVVEWLLTIVMSPNSNYSFRTYFTAVMLYDRLKGKITLGDSDEADTMFGFACLYLASVYNDIYPMSYRVVAGTIRGVISYREFNDMLTSMLKQLNYDMVFSTSADYLVRYGKLYSEPVRKVAKGILYFMVLTRGYYTLTQEKIALLSLMIACRYYDQKFKHIAFLDEDTIKQFSLCEDDLKKKFLLFASQEQSFSAMFRRITSFSLADVLNKACSKPIKV